MMSVIIDIVCRARSVVALTAAALGCVPASGLAGQYDVRSCSASVEQRADAWSQSQLPDQRVDFGDWCASGQSGGYPTIALSGGRWLAQTSTSEDRVPGHLGRIAGLRFAAPAQALVVGARYRRSMSAPDREWAIRLYAGAAVADECRTDITLPDCDYRNPDGEHVLSIPHGGVPFLDFGIHCVLAGCGYGLGPIPEAAGVIRSSVVTLEESVPPAASPLVVAGAGADGWIGADDGAATVAWSGSDPLGIRRLQVVRGAAATAPIGAVENPACVDWSTRPCGDPAAGAAPGFDAVLPVAALGLADGEHALHGRAVDAAGNTSVGPAASLRIDRTGPEAIGLAVAGHPTDPARTLTWTEPTGGSPLVGRRLQFCLAEDGCRWIAPPAGRYDFSLAAGQIATLAVELTDQAGNVALSAPATAVGPPLVPGPGPGPAPDPEPVPRPADPEPRAVTLKLSPRKALPRGSFKLRGSVAAGSAKRITIVAAGRTPRGRRTSRTIRISPRRSGRFTALIRLPKSLHRPRGLTLTVTASPAAGYRAATHTLKLR